MHAAIRPTEITRFFTVKMHSFSSLVLCNRLKLKNIFVCLLIQNEMYDIIV